MASPNMSQIGAFVDLKAGVVPAARSAGSVNGTGFDRTNYQSCVLGVQTGAVTGAPDAQSATAKIQHSSDDGSSDAYADYTMPNGVAASLAVTGASSIGELDVDLAGAKKYIRVVLTTAFTAGTAPTLADGAFLACGGKVSKT